MHVFIQMRDYEDRENFSFQSLLRDEHLLEEMGQGLILIIQSFAISRL